MLRRCFTESFIRIVWVKYYSIFTERSHYILYTFYHCWLLLIRMYYLSKSTQITYVHYTGSYVYTYIWVPHCKYINKYYLFCNKNYSNDYNMMILSLIIYSNYSSILIISIISYNYSLLFIEIVRIKFENHIYWNRWN